MLPLWSRTGLALVLVAVLCGAQDPLPKPDAFLGYPLGERFTLHGQLVAYARAAAAASDRITTTDYGRTVEGRPLLYLVITSPENHERLQRIMDAKTKLADPRELEDGADIDELVQDTPAVVWLSYNVHGNEPSPSETALRVIHRLATADDEQTGRWLSELVIILDPCLNPDGRDRYACWFNGAMGGRADPDPQALEHQEPWPGGRYNHWNFDLNRDWAFATQVETRARLPHFTRWSPQVHVDFHEMGYESSYFFFPAEKPINANLPEHTLEWGRRFGRGNADAFDEKGWLYYTGESFDLFYPGYGDSWPSFTGAIGMTYEQAGHSRAGAAVRRRDGDVLTLLQRLEHHEVATYATIETAAKNRIELLRDYHTFRKTAIEEGRDGPIRSFLLPTGSDPARTDALVRTLRLQGIEVKRTRDAFTLPRVRDALGKDVLDRTFGAGTYVIEMAQPQKRLAKTLLEPRAEIRELYFYDISAWSLPLAYGVSAFECPVRVPVATEPVTEVPTRPGGVGEGEARVAWVLPYHTRGAMEALVALLRRGIKVRSARKPFTLAGRAFARGTLVIRRHENPADAADVLDAIGRRHGVTFLPARSGFTEKGIDLGSGSVAPVVHPRIALIGGRGVGNSSFGATRFLLDQVLDAPYSVLPKDRLSSASLDRFTAVVVPDGGVDDAARKKLRSFTLEGGVVIAFGRAAFSLCQDGGAGISAKPGAKPAADAGSNGKKPRWQAERDEARRRRQQPGSIFRVELDPSHPVSFGYRTEIAAFKNGTKSFDPNGPGTHVALFADAAPVSGYVNDTDAESLKGRAYVSISRNGRGAFVLFADDPNFRGAWRGLTRLFMNAALLLPSRHVPR